MELSAFKTHIDYKLIKKTILFMEETRLRYPFLIFHRVNQEPN